MTQNLKHVRSYNAIRFDLYLFPLTCLPVGSQLEQHLVSEHSDLHVRRYRQLLPLLSSRWQCDDDDDDDDNGVSSLGTDLVIRPECISQIVMSQRHW